jgi:hypothetical protein
MSAAVARGGEYPPSTGDLETSIAAHVELSGAGFAGGSAVILSLVDQVTGEVHDLGSLMTDESGSISGTVTVPAELPPGVYTMAATGVTGDGTQLVLSAAIEIVGVNGSVQAEGSSSTGVLWIVIVLEAIALGAMWWWGFTGRRSADTGDASDAEPRGEEVEEDGS